MDILKAFNLNTEIHSWEMEFSIHLTINSQLNDQNSIRYYIILYRVYTDPCEIGPPVVQLMIFVTAEGDQNNKTPIWR
jgi:hypothetical protein